MPRNFLGIDCSVLYILSNIFSYIHRSVDVERAMLDMYLCCNSVDSSFGFITEQV